ncbi:complexin-3-like [Hyla sarda]|uniref:complexin-3-like n=1 Tax=Hyla sarda TaxID=327740 RepID=UPI0024C3A56F|nr:complexin-3-like [Hyla sarda]
MASVAKSLLGGPVKSMSCCISSGPPQERWPQPEPKVNMMRRWSSEEQHRRVLQPGRRRDSLYSQQKAERALMRQHFREKYHLAANVQDQEQVKAGDHVRLSRNLRAVVRQEEDNSEDFSITDLLANLRKSAQTTVEPGARCLVM